MYNSFLVYELQRQKQLPKILYVCQKSLLLIQIYESRHLSPCFCIFHKYKENTNCSD